MSEPRPSATGEDSGRANDRVQSSGAADGEPPRGSANRAARRDESAEGAAPHLPAARLSAGERWISLGVAVAAAAVLSLAAWLKPDARGFGTHQQLSKIHRSIGGPCGLLVTTGLPCPTCGMTTAFSFAVRGRWFSAFMAQPAGLALALATAVAGCAAAYAAIGGRAPRLPWGWVTPYRLFMALLVVLLGGWGWKLLYGFLSGALPVKSSDLWRVAGG